MKQGEAKARLAALKAGELMPCQDPYDRKKWQALAGKYRVKVLMVPEGLRRV